MAQERSTTEYWALTPGQKRYLAVKRALDAVLAALALAVLAVPMLAIAAAVKLTGPRLPVLFCQQRVGRAEKLFTLWKFRSMDRQGRVTALGRVLRTTSLDELPQLVQVLTGTMALVGPRPLVPEEAGPIHSLRRAAGVYQLRPGLTGLAQISGRDLVSDPDKAAYDRQYLQTVSLRRDLRILLATVGKVLRREDITEKQ